MSRPTGPLTTPTAVRRHPAAGQAQSLRTAVANLHAERLRIRRARRAWALSLLVFGGSLAAMFQSCSGGAGGAGGRLADSGRGESVTISDEPRAPASKRSAKTRGSKDDEIPPQIDKSARILDDMLAKMNAEEAAKIAAADADPAPAPAPVLTRPVPKPAAPRPTAVPVSGAANVAASIDDPSATASKPITRDPAVADNAAAAKSIAVRKAELATELASLLRPSAADGGDSLEALAPMLALEAIQPGAATAEIEAAVKLLTPEEAAAVRSLRDLLRKIGSEPASAADPNRLAKLLGEQMDHLSVHAPGDGPEFGTVALCARVESFGRYTPLASSRMIAGKTNSAILYTEIGRFVQRPIHEAAADGTVDQEGALIVQLEQEIELWHDGGGGGTLQWRASPAAIRDHSRTKRHDFFIVQRIDLPPNLTVGKYNLKVTVRDIGAEGSPQVQTFMPIEIIADPRVAVGGKEPRQSRDDDRTKSRLPVSPNLLKPTSLKRDEANEPLAARPVKHH